MATLTTRLGGLFRRMKSSRPVRMDIDTTHRRAAASLEQMATGRAGASDNGGFLSRLPGAKRDAAIAELKRGYGEVVDLIRSVRTHLEQQSQRGQSMHQIMQRLPDALDALPEANRNQARMLEAITQHLDNQNRQASRLNEVLGALAHVTEHQGQLMGVIQQQLESGRSTDQQMLSGLTSMNSTLERLSESNLASVTALDAISSHAKQSDQHMETVIRRNARHMTALSVASWLFSSMALGVAVYVAYMLAQLISSGAG